MKVLPIPAFKDNYIWIIVDEENKTVICIDPGDANPVINFINVQSLELIAVILTHHHNDHIGGVAELLDAFPTILVYGPEDPRIPHLTHVINSQTELALLSCHFQILETPGHTSTHISLYEPYYEWLFCGDTLFSAGCGRVFDGTIEQLYDSLNKLKALPEQTKVFCAHEYTRQNLRFAALVEPANAIIQEYITLLNQDVQCSLPSTIALEREINPFLRTNSGESKSYTEQQGNKNTDPFSVFKQLRADKDAFS